MDSALALHKKYKGKLETKVVVPIKNKNDMALVYTPGVAEVSKAIALDTEKVYDYTIKSHTVAVISDGSAVLGLGNIGPEAALPVMEGKAALFKTFANIDAVPLCLNTQDLKEIISIVKALAPNFGGINLEDISAPRCFEIEEALQDLGIPVMHDDQHGTAVVVLAGLINAAKVVEKKMCDLKVVVSGAGAAGHAISKLLSNEVGDVIVCDSKGIIDRTRIYDDTFKKKLSLFTNKENISGQMQVALKKADVFVGVSAPNILLAADVASMNEKSIVFALANPIPEIMPEEAVRGGAFIVATGRSDYPNQVNNSLAFPGIFRGALEARAPRITEKMKIDVAHALANLVTNPTPEKIIPEPFDEGISEIVAKAISEAN